MFPDCGDGNCLLSLPKDLVLYEPIYDVVYDEQSKDLYEKMDYAELHFSPCDENDPDNSSRVAKCSDKRTIFEMISNHKFRLRYKKKDDTGNAYYVEHNIPKIGNSISIYMREVTTINEDFHFLFGYAFIGLFTEMKDSPGVTREFEISHISPESENPDESAMFSATVYIRQDPFKQTIYI